MTMQPHEIHDAQPFHMGDRIRKAREFAGFRDVRAFSEATGLDRGSLGRYEATGKVPRRSALIAIAWHTPVRLEWLETGQGRVFKEDSGPDDGSHLRESNPRPIHYE